MNVQCVNGCSFVNYRAGKKPNPCVVEKAKAELEQIERQGKVAGTDSAWWRNGYNEAVQSLKDIAAGKEAVEQKSYKSPLASFFGKDEDGLI